MLKAAVVGVGYLGKFHAEKLSKSGLADLVAVVDSIEERANDVAKSFKAIALTDFRQLPGLGVSCAVVSCTTSNHFSVAAWLLANGIDVLIEKPMTTSIEEAKTLIELARTHGRILQVGHLERFNPAFTELKKLLTRPWFFEVRRISPFRGRGHDVDVVLDLMIHDIDIILHLVDRPLLHVEAMGIPVLTSSVDIANARLTFEGGTVANVSASRAAFHGERTIRVFQPELYISLDYENKKLKVARKSGDSDLLGFPKIQSSERKIEERDALQEEVNSFLRCVFDRSRPLVSGEDGLRALELVNRVRSAMEQSAAEFDVPPPKSFEAVNQ